MNRFALALCLCLSAAALADEPAKSSTPVDASKSPGQAPWDFPPLPRVPSPHQPIDPLPPDAVPKLLPGWTYAFSLPEPCFVIASPPGRVIVAQNAGPINVPGIFLGGEGKPEVKSFSGAAVFTVVGIGSGRVELLLVKVGAKGPGDVARRLVDVDSGHAPQPPPTPDPFNPLASKFRDAYRADKAAGKAGAQYPPLIADSLSAVASRNGAGAFKSIGEVNAAFKKEVLARAAIPAGQQPALRAEVANALNRPPLNLDGFTAITNATRPQITNLMLEIAEAVKGAAQ